MTDLLARDGRARPARTAGRDDVPQVLEGPTPRGWRPLRGHSLSSWLCTAGLLTTVVAGKTEYLGWPFAPNRFLLAAALVALGVEWTLPRATRQRARDAAAGRPWPRLRLDHALVAMVAFTLWATGSAIAFGTFGTDYGRYALIDRLIIPFAFFALGPLVYRTGPQRDLLLKVFVLLGIYLGLTAFFEIIGPHALVRPTYILDPLGGDLAATKRAHGPFLGAEPDGLMMITCVFAAWFATRRLRWWWLPASWACLGLASLGCLLTMTRSIWLGFVAAVVVVALRDPRLRRWFPVVALVLVLGLLGALGHFPGLQRQVNDRFETQGSLYDRATANEAALRIAAEHPLTGIGWVRYQDNNSPYVRQADDHPIGNTAIEVHNVFLGRLAELGIPGAALWLLVVLLGPVAALRLTRVRGARDWLDRVLGPPETGWWTLSAATTASWLACCLTSPTPYPLANLLVFLFAGLLVADAHHPPVIMHKLRRDHARTPQ